MVTCPNCGNEMEKGVLGRHSSFFAGASGIIGKKFYWAKKKGPFTAEDKISLDHFGENNAEAHICKRCRLILTGFWG